MTGDEEKKVTNKEDRNTANIWPLATAPVEACSVAGKTFVQAVKA